MRISDENIEIVATILNVFRDGQGIIGGKIRVIAKYVRHKQGPLKMAIRPFQCSLQGCFR